MESKKVSLNLEGFIKEMTEVRDRPEERANASINEVKTRRLQQRKNITSIQNT